MTAIALSKRAVFAGEAILIGWLLATEDLGVLGFAALGLIAALVMAVVTSMSWPLGALLVLTASSAMPRLAASVAGLHLRPEHIAIAFAGLALAWRALGKPGVSRLPLRTFDYFLIAYIAMNFFTSAATSPQPHLTLRWAALNAIAVSPYFLISWMVTDEGKLHRAFQFLLAVGAVEAAYGVFCFLSNRAFQTTFGVEGAQYGSIPGTYGTQYEANLFGSYTACCAIMFLACLTFGAKSRRSLYGLGFAITLLAALISLARSVLLALPVAAFFVIWIALRRRELKLRKLVPWAVVFALVLLAVSPFVFNLVKERFSTIDVSELGSDSTSLVRIVQMAVAAEDVQAHPVLGTGTASFQLFFDWDDYLPGMQGENDVAGWVGNTPLRILHDTGIIGLAIFLGFLIALARAVRKAVRNAGHDSRTIMIALSAGLVLYAITFQATEATILAFTWVHLGLLAAAVKVIQSSHPLSQATPLEANPGR